MGNVIYVNFTSITSSVTLLLVSLQYLGQDTLYHSCSQGANLQCVLDFSPLLNPLVKEYYNLLFDYLRTGHTKPKLTLFSLHSLSLLTASFTILK